MPNASKQVNVCRKIPRVKLLLTSTRSAMPVVDSSRRSSGARYNRWRSQAMFEEESIQVRLIIHGGSE